MKKFLVFCFDDYYPMGGMNDCYAKCDTLEEAKMMGKRALYKNCQIYDVTVDMIAFDGPIIDLN